MLTSKPYLAIDRGVSAWALCALLALAAGCGGGRSVYAAAGSEERIPGVKVRQLTDKGGRVAWHHGSKHKLIAYDSITSRDPYRLDVYVTEADGSNKRCVTCDMEELGNIKGNPDWHPDGEHLLLQVGNENAGKISIFNHVSFGFNNDLWIISLDGKRAEKIWSTPLNNAALHAHFNKKGDKLVFARRKKTGKSRLIWRLITPDGENHWDGWRIHLADFNLKKSGENMLSNHRELQPNGDGMYETHGFAPDGRLVYSHTEGGRAYVDDIYKCDPDGGNVENMTQSRNTWEEHGSYSPDGRSFAFMSSRIDPSLKFPKAKPRNLRSELYLRDSNGKIRRVTDMNSRRGEQTAVSDYAWGPDGKSLAVQVAPFEEIGLDPEIWIVELP